MVVDPFMPFDTAAVVEGARDCHLALGKREKGLVYATGAGLPGVYQARSVILTQMPTDDILGHEHPNKS